MEAGTAGNRQYDHASSPPTPSQRSAMEPEVSRPEPDRDNLPRRGGRPSRRPLETAPDVSLAPAGRRVRRSRGNLGRRSAVGLGPLLAIAKGLD